MKVAKPCPKICRGVVRRGGWWSALRFGRRCRRLCRIFLICFTRFSSCSQSECPATQCRKIIGCCLGPVRTWRVTESRKWGSRRPTIDVRNLRILCSPGLQTFNKNEHGIRLTEEQSIESPFSTSWWLRRLPTVRRSTNVCRRWFIVNSFPDPSSPIRDWISRTKWTPYLAWPFLPWSASTCFHSCAGSIPRHLCSPEPIPLGTPSSPLLPCLHTYSNTYTRRLYSIQRLLSLFL